MNNSPICKFKLGEYQAFLPCLVEYFRYQVSKFLGQISNYAKEGRTLTSDIEEILETVLGQRIEFTLTPVQVTPPPQSNWSQTEGEFIDMKIQRLLLNKVIKHSVYEEGEFIFPIFVRPKKDGSYRKILNLKSLNKYVTYHHLKMDSIWTAVQMMAPGCYVPSIDF